MGVCRRFKISVKNASRRIRRASVQSPAQILRTFVAIGLEQFRPSLRPTRSRAGDKTGKLVWDGCSFSSAKGRASSTFASDHPRAPWSGEFAGSISTNKGRSTPTKGSRTVGREGRSQRVPGIKKVGRYTKRSGLAQVSLLRLIKASSGDMRTLVGIPLKASKEACGSFRSIQEIQQKGRGDSINSVARYRRLELTNVRSRSSRPPSLQRPLRCKPPYLRESVRQCYRRLYESPYLDAGILDRLSATELSSREWSRFVDRIVCFARQCRLFFVFAERVEVIVFSIRRA